jgi:hypothetical protein
MQAVAGEPSWLEAMRRGSGLSLDDEGRWRFGAGFVENERVAELFHQGLERRADGEVILRVGGMWCYVKCSGPMRFVRRFDWRQEVAELFGGRMVSLSGAVAGWGPDSRLYLWFDGVEGPALCSRTAHQDAISRFVEVDERLAIAFGEGKRCTVEALEEVPRAGSPRPPT